MEAATNIISGSTLLRTLTEKSTLKFGKRADIPIWKLLECGSGKAYLSWVYYNCSIINFTDAVLLKLSIRPEERITKPGVNRELQVEKQKNINKWAIAKHGCRVIGKKKKAAKRYLRGKSNLRKTTKGAMARSNQGH